MAVKVSTLVVSWVVSGIVFATGALALYLLVTVVLEVLATNRGVDKIREENTGRGTAKVAPDPSTASQTTSQDVQGFQVGDDQ